MFASLSLLHPGRIFLGIGSGEALNEEAAIGSWPKWSERSERLVEAAEVRLGRSGRSRSWRLTSARVRCTAPGSMAMDSSPIPIPGRSLSGQAAPSA